MLTKSRNILIIIIFSVCFLSSVNAMAESKKPVENKPIIITSIAPLKAILQEIVKDRVELVNLLPAGASPHTYEPKPSDIKKVQSAAVVFHVAHSLDGWVLKLPIKKSVEVIEFLPEKYRLPLIHRHHHHGEEKHEEHQENFDPHFWTDPVAVKEVVPGVVKVMCEGNKVNCEYFKENSVKFLDDLDRLDSTLKQLTNSVNKNAVLLSHPFFFYFLKRYGFSTVQVIEKIPGKQPTGKELAKILKFAQKAGIKTVFSLKQLSRKPAEIVAESVSVKIVELDPIGGSGELESYEGLILSNARLLVNGLK